MKFAFIIVSMAVFVANVRSKNSADLVLDYVVVPHSQTDMNCKSNQMIINSVCADVIGGAPLVDKTVATAFIPQAWVKDEDKKVISPQHVVIVDCSAKCKGNGFKSSNRKQCVSKKGKGSVEWHDFCTEIFSNTHGNEGGFITTEVYVDVAQAKVSRA